MNKKKKWLSLLTIVTSLILCIISTFGITLAFFGGNASANLSTITLKTGIEIGAAIESSVGSAKVVPGQPVKITATGTVSATTQGTNPDANNAVDGVVRAKFNVGNELGTVTIAGNNTDFWKEGGDGYYYLVTAANGTTLRTVSKGTSVQIFGDLVVSKNFTNADSGKSVEASVIFEVIQADIYKTDGTKIDLTVANATTSTSPLYSAFDAVEFKTLYGTEIETAYYNIDNIGEAKPVKNSVNEEGYSVSVYPYAIAKSDNQVLLYYAFNTPAEDSLYNKSIRYSDEYYQWIQSIFGGMFPEEVYLIQDDTYVIKNLQNYDNVVVARDTASDSAETKEGPLIGVVVLEGRTDTELFIENFDKLVLSFTTVSFSGGSN